MPELHRFDYGTAAFAAQEELGLSVVKGAAFVLVAGGLGERLGYSDIKLSLPVQSLTEQCYLELYIAQILAMQAKAQCGALPLAIMTSDDTHARTVALLAKHANFGAAPGQVTLIKQEKVPALLDNAARFAVEEGEPYALETKPHGHGDVHTLLASSGLAEAWAAAGRTHIVFFQDTNALCFTVTIAALGVSAGAGLDLNSIAVPRKAKDAVGAITKLVRPDGTSLTINVEYNQLEPMLKSSGFPEGDVNGADGFSPFPGNINQLIFAVPAYVEVLKRTGGLVPEFVNPKYADATKTRFKKPTRLECMMQVRPGGQEGRRAALGGATPPPHTHSTLCPLPLSRTRTRTRAPRARPAGPAQGLSLQRQGGCLHV
jgi:UDP-sugar pyrophosphorylase